MKRVWKRISALLVVCAVLAALAPAALADGGADTYRIAVSAVPAVVTAGGSATVSATVYSRSETDGEWSEYLGGGAVITWQAYRAGVAAFRGEDADKPVTTALNAGSSSSSLELLTKAGGVTGSAVQLPLSVSVTVGGENIFRLRCVYHDHAGRGFRAGPQRGVRSRLRRQRPLFRG